MTEPCPDRSSLMASGADLGIKLCLDCHRVCQIEDSQCPRCGSKVRLRKKDSLSPLLGPDPDSGASLHSCKHAADNDGKPV